MGLSIIDKISSKYVPKWGNEKKYIYLHYLGVTGENYELAPDGTGAHFTIYHDGRIFQRCSLDAIVWAVGTANGMYKQKHPTARNSNGISIELCCYCDGNKNNAEDKKWYFTKETQEAAVWLVQKLMKECSIPADNVLRHWDVVNKWCPSPWCNNNKYKTSWTWDEFKAKIGAKSEHVPGFGIPASVEEYVETCGNICMALYPCTQLLPSAIVAQCYLENGGGFGADAVELTEVNNVLGMKVDLLNSTWKQYSVWTGEQIEKITPEYKNGVLVHVPDYFRAYPKGYAQCIEDYEMFLLNAKLGANYKYRRLQGVTDPALFYDYLRNDGNGYFTDPNYKTKCMDIINRLNLVERFDKPVLSGGEEVANHPWLTVANGYNTKMKQMVKEGKRWFYSNSGCKNTWKSAVTNEKYKTNCARLLCWILRNQKILKSGQYFWCDHGEMKWYNDETRENVYTACDVIHINGKLTLSQLISSGNLKPGDMIGYQNMRHMNLYAGSKKFYDAGTCYEPTHGEGANFHDWYGGLVYGAENVAWIIRRKAQKDEPKPTKKTVYRVQVGAFSTKTAMQKVSEKLAGYKYGTFWEKLSDGYMHLFCGSYENKNEAQKRASELWNKCKQETTIKEFTIDG